MSTFSPSSTLERVRRALPLPSLQALREVLFPLSPGFLLFPHFRVYSRQCQIPQFYDLQRHSRRTPLIPPPPQMNPQTNVIYIISRKFKYIRKTLYKKCDEMNLFDHSCRDIEERLSFLINVVLSLCVLTYTNGASPPSLSRPGFQLEFVYEIALLYLVDWVVDPPLAKA